MDPLHFAIVGCGLVGAKRARAAVALGHRVVALADVRPGPAEALACSLPEPPLVTTNADEAIEDPRVGAVIIATPHDRLAPTALAAIRAGRHVLVEKPGARRASELRPVVDALRAGTVRAKAGFNHRFHPAIQRAMALVREGRIGPLLFVRGRYGHGGRPGYDREWRADPEVAGGGELLDQGTHLIDLSRWFLGEFVHVEGFAPTYFWNTAVDDNAFLLLRTRDDRVAWLHASWTEWKNLFCFEVVGRDGMLRIDGLGGSYGIERLSCYYMRPEMGPPETVIYEYPAGDRSFELELADFVHSIETGAPPTGSVEDALAALEIVDRVYRRSSE